MSTIQWQSENERTKQIRNKYKSSTSKFQVKRKVMIDIYNSLGDTLQKTYIFLDFQ